MCGIAGIVGSPESADTLQELASRAILGLRHRGRMIPYDDSLGRRHALSDTIGHSGCVPAGTSAHDQR